MNIQYNASSSSLDDFGYLSKAVMYYIITHVIGYIQS